MPDSTEKLTTRDRILDAAMELFAEEGFKGTTISAVERRVGLAAGTGSFYRHFASKEALLRAAVDAEVARCLADVGTERQSMTVPDDSRARLVSISTQILRDLRRFDRLFRLMLTDTDRTPAVRDAVTTALQASGAVSWTDDPATVVVIGALVGFHIFELIGTGPVGMITEHDFVDTLARLADNTGTLHTTKRTGRSAHRE